jgi:hypothetical protein
MRFTPFSRTSTPLADSHAIALTNMLHQTLSETDIPAGWHQACQYQWERHSFSSRIRVRVPRVSAHAERAEGREQRHSRLRDVGE